MADHSKISGDGRRRLTYTDALKVETDINLCLDDLHRELSIYLKDGKAGLKRFLVDYIELTDATLAGAMGISLKMVQRLRDHFDVIKRPDAVGTSRPYYRKPPPVVEIPGIVTVRWLELIIQHHNFNTIAVGFGLSPKTVLSTARRLFGTGAVNLAIQSQRRQHPCNNERWLREHFSEKGLSVAKLSKLAGVTDATIVSWLTRWNIHCRNTAANVTYNRNGR